MPLFISVLPSITLAGIPDKESDEIAGKRTVAVRFGKKAAAAIAFCFTVLAAAIVLLYILSGVYTQVFGVLIYFVIPHACWLCFLLYRYIQNPSPPHRIDKLLAVALSYIIWFGLIPLLNV